MYVYVRIDGDGEPSLPRSPWHTRTHQAPTHAYAGTNGTRTQTH